MSPKPLRFALYSGRPPTDWRCPRPSRCRGPPSVAPAPRVSLRAPQPRHAARWQLEHSAPFQVAINLSARQLVEPGLADRVTEVMQLTGVHPSSLCFEIPASVLTDDAATVPDVLSRVRALGVQFAIADFGPGHAAPGSL